MSAPRFYIPSAEWNADNLALTGAEAHHCLDVMRRNVGDRVVAFNERGVEATVEIESMDKDRIGLRMVHSLKTEPLSAQITLGQAIPKGKHMDFIIQKSTELGAHAIVPLLSERTVVKMDAEEAAKKQDKWQRAAIEACKQCGQNWLPEVQKPVSIERFFENGPKFDLMLIASLQPDSRHLKDILAEHEEIQGKKPESVLVLIGPEGDYTPAEISLARGHGCLPLSLGPIVLRTETASVYTLSILAHELLHHRA